MTFPAALDVFADPRPPGAGQYVWLDGTIRDALTLPANILVASNPALVHSTLTYTQGVAIQNLEAKVGINSSLVATSLDYIVSNTLIKINGGSVTTARIPFANGISVTQTSGSALTNSPFQILGFGLDGTSDATGGVVAFMTHNGSGNRQFVLSATENFGLSTAAGFRFLMGAGIANIDGITCDGSFRVPVNFGTDTSDVSVGNSGYAYNATLRAKLDITTQAAKVGLVVGSASGGTAQSSDFIQVINTAGTVLSKTTAAGSFLYQGTGLSVHGRSTNSTGDTSDITGTTDQILRANTAGTAIGFGSINLAASAAVGSTVLGATNGGSGLSTYAQGDIIYASATNTLSALAKNTTATRYLSNTGTSNNPAWAQIALGTGVSGQLPIANGGHAGSSAAAGVTNLISPLTDASGVVLTGVTKFDWYCFWNSNNATSYRIQGNVLASNIAGIASQIKGQSTNKTANYTATSSDGTIYCDATAGAFTITLLTAIGNGGIGFNIVKTDSSANAITIATTSSQTINGATTQTLSTQYQSMTPTSNAANWFLT